ncbi:hypothetical protein EMCRGX_G017724 [Ephydatia muelleri]
MEVVIDNVFDESPKLTYRIRSRDPLDQVPEGEEVRRRDDTMEEETHTRVGSEGDVPDTRSGTASKEGAMKRWKRRLSESFLKLAPNSSTDRTPSPRKPKRPQSLVVSPTDACPPQGSMLPVPFALVAPSSLSTSPTKAFGPTPTSTDTIVPTPVPAPNGATTTGAGVAARRKSVRKHSDTCDMTTSPFGRLDAYQKLEALGEGSYATVYKGISNVNGQLVALKEIRLNSEEGTPFTAIREASLLKGLKHANIVTLHDIIHTSTNLTFVFEYVNTDLSRYMERRPGPLDANNVQLFLFQLLRGLYYCHVRKILHRDLKPQNLLISESGELKLADFGLARAKSVPTHSYSNEVVTLWYRPPDVLMGSTEYSTSLDMWGVGCIFVEMLTGKPLFPGIKGPVDQLNKIWQVMGTPNDSTWPGVSSFPEYKPCVFKKYMPQSLYAISPQLSPALPAGDLSFKLLQLIPTRRLLAHDALHHAYFSSLPPAIYTIPDDASILTIPGVVYYR